MTAAAVELLAGTAALLLFAVGQHVDVHGPRRKVLQHHPLVRPVVFVCAVDAACVPVCPEDMLVVYRHGKRVDGCTHDHLAVGSGKRTSLNLLSEWRKHHHYFTIYILMEYKTTLFKNYL